MLLDNTNAFPGGEVAFAAFIDADEEGVDVERELLTLLDIELFRFIPVIVGRAKAPRCPTFSQFAAAPVGHVLVLDMPGCNYR